MNVQICQNVLHIRNGFINIFPSTSLYYSTRPHLKGISYIFESFIFNIICKIIFLISNHIADGIPILSINCSAYKCFRTITFNIFLHYHNINPVLEHHSNRIWQISTTNQFDIVTNQLHRSKLLLFHNCN